LELHPLSAPEVDTPSVLFACAKRNGHGYLDTSLTELEQIGEQIHLMVTNSDGNGDPLPTLTQYYTVLGDHCYKSHQPEQPKLL
jgi:hypothetical protein